MTEITVTPWGTRQALPEDPSAPMHSALWNIATEQAVISRMKKTGEDWTTAAENIDDPQIIEHLNAVCDDNGFRRLDGKGTGRDPNLILDGEHIRVRIDPKELNQPAPGVGDGGPQSLNAYNKAVGNPNASGVDINKKQRLDEYLGSIPGFAALPDGTKAALIEAYGREGINKQGLATVAGCDLFKRLDQQEQQRLLASYGVKGKEVVTGEMDKLATAGVNDDTGARIKVISSAGFGAMTPTQQQQFLARLSQDHKFREAVVTIISQPNFKDKDATGQGHALDILRRYSSRKGDGYGGIDEKNRSAVLVALYNDVLAKPEFKLHEVSPFQQESAQQTRSINDFADNKAKTIRA